jgi:ppGpp synthetase/RelA/SpoT-type nucleotidyltranferase
VRLPKIAARLGIYPIIMGRAKSLESFAEKIQRPSKDYKKDPLIEATDLAGVRVITHLLSDSRAFAREVRSEFSIDEENSEDKSRALKVAEFGYLSNHLIISLPEAPSRKEFAPEMRSKINVRQLKRLRGLKCELQVRTLCQHVWADVFHELGYKNEFQLPELWRREFAKIAAMLEVCDREFMEIRESLAAYESTYSAYMDQDELALLATRLKILLKLDPKNTRTGHRLLRTYFALDRSGDIERLLGDPKLRLYEYPPALRDAGECLVQVHKRAPASDGFRQGQELLKKALQLAPRDVDAWCSLGGTYRRQARQDPLQWAEALRCYREGFAIEPENPYALGQYLACELVHGVGLPVLAIAQAALKRAIERCRKQLEVRVNLPWAAYDTGLFCFYLGDIASAIRAYALGILRSHDAWMVESALNPIRDFMDKPLSLPGLDLLRELLELAMLSRDKLRGCKAAPGVPKFQPPVAVLAGGCGGVEATDKGLGILSEALSAFQGTLVSGGTRSGVAAIPGDLQVRNTLRTIGYLPAHADGLDDIRDHRYSSLQSSGGDEFSVREALLFWRHYLSSGLDPGAVRLLGYNGGAIAACEFRIALALGARVGIIQGSGREADKFLHDPFWVERGKWDQNCRLNSRVESLPLNVEAIRGFLGC